MHAEPHRPSEFITPHLFLQVLLSGLVLIIMPFGGMSLAVPVIIALLPLPLYFMPGASEAAARTYLCSVGAALLCALVIYAVWIVTIMWLLRGFGRGW